MASTPSTPNRDTLRDLLPIWMWDDEKPKTVGAIDHDGWSYIYYGLHYDVNAASHQHSTSRDLNLASNLDTAVYPTQSTVSGFSSGATCMLRDLARFGQGGPVE